MTKMTTIWVSEKNKIRLSAIGHQPDSLNDVLGRVLDVYEEIKAQRLMEEKMR